MYKIVVTDIHVITRLYSLLKYFNSSELCFYITDFCYRDNSTCLPGDMVIARKLADDGILTVVKSDPETLKTIHRHFLTYKPKFVVKTISALVLAQTHGYRLFTKDDLLKEIALQDFKIMVHGKEWLVSSLVNEIATLGITLDIEIMRDII